MKTIRAQIEVEIEFGDLEYLELLDIYKRCMNIDGNLELPEEVAERFVQNGKVTDNCYIPHEVFEEN